MLATKHQPATSGRAAVVTAPGTIEIEPFEPPAPGRGQVRIALEGCGVCASNLVPWSGPDWMKFPTEPGGLGHEGWGVIDAVGADVVGLHPGIRVAALSYNAYATHDIAKASAVVPLPEELRDVPFPGEPLACAINIFRRSTISAGQTVAIVGIGFLGALLSKIGGADCARVLDF